MRDSSSFIIEPYLKATTVRSPLGFMSQATYWAQLLFPGITVLKVLQTEARKIEPLDTRTAEAAHIARLVLATLEQDSSIVRLFRKRNQNLDALRHSREQEDLDRNAGHRTSGIVEVLTGENPERRVSVSRDFLTPGNPFLLIMTNVCSMGVDLHNYCWDVIHYSPSWTPSDFEQKSGRIDRV